MSSYASHCRVINRVKSGLVISPSFPCASVFINKCEFSIYGEACALLFMFYGSMCFSSYSLWFGLCFSLYGEACSLLYGFPCASIFMRKPVLYSLWLCACFSPCGAVRADIEKYVDRKRFFWRFRRFTAFRHSPFSKICPNFWKPNFCTFEISQV